MINRLKKYICTIVNNYICTFNRELISHKATIEEHRKEIQELSGRICILDEQQEIMHNFLVEINKYLVEKKDGIRVNETKAKGKKANERGNHQRKAN